MKQKWQTLGIVSRDQGLVSNIKGDETLSVLIIPYLSHFEKTKQDEVSIHIHCGEQTRIVVLILAI